MKVQFIFKFSYKDKLKQFDSGYDYIAHMTVGKVSSMESLDKTFNDINNCNSKFSAVVKKISVEMIGSIKNLIRIEYELN